MWQAIVERLQQGEHVTLRPVGNSMTPIIKSRQRVVISPVTETPRVGDVVLARVAGRFYLHKITAYEAGRFQISNNHGHINGWTKAIYGVVTQIG